MDRLEEKEVLDRLRRIETRVTKYLQEQGFDTQSQKCRWDPTGIVHIPSTKVALQEIVEVIPADARNEDIEVHHNNSLYCIIAVED